MKHEERKEEQKTLKEWKKPELQELNKGKTFNGYTPATPEDVFNDS
jgi:hypothetical protein